MFVQMVSVVRRFPCWLLGLVALGSVWRLPSFVFRWNRCSALHAAPKHEQVVEKFDLDSLVASRARICLHEGMSALLDLPFALLAAPVVLTLWRAPSLLGSLVSTHRRHRHAANLVTDKKRKGDPPTNGPLLGHEALSAWASKRNSDLRRVTISHFSQCCFDIPCAAAFLLLLATVYRAPLVFSLVRTARSKASGCDDTKKKTSNEGHIDDKSPGVTTFLSSTHGIVFME